MGLIRTGIAVALATLLSACGAQRPAVPDVASMDRGGGTAYRLVDARIDVPGSLRVSEANRFYPIADIVWRGEPPGDRRAQVRAIFAEGLARGAAGLTAGTPAVAEVEVLRFHSLTEKARYTVGGVHSIRFLLTLRDPATGAVLDGPRRVVADARASGGARAMAEEAQGRTQRVLIVEDLARVFRRELAGGGAPARAAPAPAAVRTAAAPVATLPPAPVPKPGQAPRRAISPWDWIDLPPADMLD